MLEKSAAPWEIHQEIPEANGDDVAGQLPKIMSCYKLSVWMVTAKSAKSNKGT